MKTPFTRVQNTQSIGQRARLVAPVTFVGGYTFINKGENSLAGKQETVSALNAAANLLIAARRLREFSEPAQVRALELLYGTNPALVNFALYELGNVFKGSR